MCTLCSVYYGLMLYIRCCHGVMGASACECESEGHTCMSADQLVGCPGDEARQCMIVAMY